MSKVEHLVSFRDGSYKKIANPTDWKHSQWIHYTKPSGDVVMINPKNVNYIEIFNNKGEQ